MIVQLKSVSTTILLIALSATGTNATPQLITASMAAAPGSVTAASMANSLLDPNSGFTLALGANTEIKNQNPASTDSRAIGIFNYGNIAPGTNMGDSVDTGAVFSGGIGIESGVCLTTGFLSDYEPTRGPSSVPFVGVEGPNNGFPTDSANGGEVSKILYTFPDSDDDFAAVFAADNLQPGGDPAVLEFPIDLHSPGFLRVGFVFASDEFPAWFGTFNDTFAILVKGPCTPDGGTGENLATFIDGGLTKNFSLQALVMCPLIFLKNQMSPTAMQEYPNSPHKIGPPYAPDGYATYYDHEFGGFSTLLTRETNKPLAPGRYTIKFVIEDVADKKVDSALFLQSHGIKLFSLAQGDFNGSGCVDSADYVTWRAHLNMTGASFSDGDANGDCVVDWSDYDIWRANFGNSGNTNFQADFNRDGKVDFSDFQILVNHYVMTSCASRFEGDANGDGRVDYSDYQILVNEYGKTSCGCNCSGNGAAMMAGNGAADSSESAAAPANPGLNGDGKIDDEELAALDRAILGTEFANYNARISEDVSVTEIPPELALPESTAAASAPAIQPPPTPTQALSR